MAIWRINLKPGAANGVDARKHCIDNSVVGVGWQVDFEGEDVTPESYQRIAAVVYKDTSWWAAFNAICYRMEVDDLIWTRDWSGIYYLGQIKSDWFYDHSNEASNADIVNVRSCTWFKIGTVDTVPGKLVNCFIPARTVQRVNDETVSAFSMITYNEKSGTPRYDIPLLDDLDIFSLLSSKYCEDALALYLQYTYDYMVVPSSCRSDTMAYEFVLVDKKTGEKAVVQVKNGRNFLNADDYRNIDEKVFLFTTQGEYGGQESEKVRFVDPEKIRKFLNDKTELLPDKMKLWIKLLH
jgi:hypothetical protein